MEIRDHIPTRNILVGVDLQNDFISGSLAVRGGENVINPINEVARAVRQSMGQVAFTRDWHPSETPHFDKWPVHCVADTDGAAFHPDLEVLKNDIIISKGMGQTDGYSGMEGISESGETLESIIDTGGRWEDANVFIGGLATDFCVESTAIDLAERFLRYRNVNFYGISDAMKPVDLHRGDGKMSIQFMKKVGIAMVNSAKAIQIIENSKNGRWS